MSSRVKVILPKEEKTEPTEAVTFPEHMPINMDAYLSGFKRQSFWLVSGAQALIVFLVVLIAILSGEHSLASFFVWGMVIASMIIGVTTHYVLILYMSQPSLDIVRAVIHTADAGSSETPPNPNIPRYAKSGFREILLAIYELSTVAKKEPDVEVHSEIGDLLAAGIEDSPAAVMVLNHDRKVIYHNQAAPVAQTTDGALVPDLIFSSDNDFSLNKWLDKCEKHSVHDNYTWFRVPTRLTGESDRKIYDIMASYQKASKAETMLVLFDRTNEYAPEDEEMDFISFAAHELRGPITVIRGYLDVLDDELKPVLENDQAELFGRLIVSANRLSGYINNILNASRYDRQHLKLHMKEHQIYDAYDLIKDDMELRAKAQSRMLNVEFPDHLPTVAIDTNSISEVMSNFIDNAIKYSNEGGQVNVTARQAGEFVQVSIEDHGIGMPSNVIGNLFHKFYRSHRSRETVAGTGIGLYISKAIVESHGGSVDVRSIEGKGSTFSFTVPVYATVAYKLKSNDNSNKQLIEHSSGWIKNHSMYRG